VTKISYPVKIRFLSFTCEDIMVVMATSVSANEIYKSYMPYCYNIQNTFLVTMRCARTAACQCTDQSSWVQTCCWLLSRLSVTQPLFDSVSLPIFCCFVFCLQWTWSTISLGLTTWIFSSFVTRHVAQIDKLVERSDCRTCPQSKHRGLTRLIPIHSLRGYCVYKPIIYFRYEFVSEIKPYV